VFVVWGNRHGGDRPYLRSRDYGQQRYDGYDASDDAEDATRPRTSHARVRSRVGRSDC
jgi:hypothetical protein